VASLEIIDFEVRLLTALVAPLRYLGKTVWPLRLSFLYPIPSQRYSWWLIGASVLFLIGAPLAAFRFRRRCPVLPTALFWFLGTLVPVSGLVQIGGQSLADRYTYLPHAGLALLAGWFIGRSSGNGRRWLVAVLAAVLVLLAGRTRWQTTRWRDSETLFRAALEVDPGNWLALNNLGILMDDMGDTVKAEHYLTRALEQRPLSQEVNHNMGMMYVHRGRGEQALVYLGRALEADPKSVKNHEAMGAVLARLGRPGEAAEHFREAILLKPKDAALHNNLGVALADLGLFDEAIEYFSRAIALKPDYAEGYANRGGVLSALGIYTAAADDYRAALRLQPDLEAARRGLAGLEGSF
jgi:tetratricopeptide (TPR) repeat protein